MLSPMPGYGARFWAERTPASRRTSHPVFRGEVEADVVVIGGGLTGTTMASVLAGGGLDVVLVESGRIASGATAASLGLLLPQPDAAFRAAEDLAGIRSARTAWKEARGSGRELARRLSRLSPKSDVTPSSVLINAATPEQATALRREQSARRAAGLDAPWVAARTAQAALGTESAGAVRLADASLFDPVRGTLALAADSARRGARLFERSPVLRTKFTRKDALVVLEHGTIRARGVVVATGEPGRLFGQLRRHVREQQGFVVVTEPLTAAMRRETGRRDAVLAEIGEAPHLLRWLPDHRALFAGALAPPVPARQLDQALVQRTGQLMYELSLRYPAISGLPARWSWSTPVVSTPDGLPWIGPHRNYPFHFFALAFGWHGDALAWWAARAALRFFTGQARREDELLGFIRHL
jgi:glycine/D-amino acid oxidase-like deaminating enzyme